MKFYYSLFYTIYDWAIRSDFDNIPLFKTIGSVTLLVSMNIFSILILIDRMAPILPDDISFILVGILFTLLFLVNNFIFTHKERYKEIINDYSEERKVKKQIRQIIVGVYVVISLNSPVLVMALTE